MRLGDIIALRIAADNITWTSPAEPQGADWYETRVGMGLMPKTHPPSLKNPQRVKIPTAQDGWLPGASKEARKKALEDMAEVHSRMLRQIGRPAIAQTAAYPLYPDLSRVT